VTDTLRPGMAIEISFVSADMFIPAAPGNEWVADGRCLDRKPGDYGYVCYAARGHAGDHIGWSAPGRHANDAVWPNPVGPVPVGRAGGETPESLAAAAGLTFVPHPAGRRVMWGFTGAARGLTRPRSRPYADVCICDECAVEPGKLESVRERAVALHDGAGRFMPLPGGYDYHFWKCRVCRRERQW
jgi:hypothetical protein